ncbi:MAG TPA: alkaline phosphatase family protein [Candidatus Limnocylindria bacterium]|nr:alkaline phosphatase family protein [Candidatus Limnocylindria bacterium]
MSARMVVLLVDALGWELAQRVPVFAPQLGHRRRLETILGFSSGALPTLFTGRPPSEHGRWLMYRRATNGTPFRGFQWLRLLPHRIQRSQKLARTLGEVLRRRGVRGYYHLYEVPRWLLSEFDLPERADIFAPGGLPVPSLWDDLERRGIAWRGWNWRTPEAQNLTDVARRLEEGVEAFLFCYTADLDATLHREGSSGAGVSARMRRYAAWLEQIDGAARRRGETLWIYLVSDHGMVDVNRVIDLQARLQPLSVRWPRDYLAFFDSTMARFWWRSATARTAVHAALREEPAGRWLTDDELEREGALFPGRDYGEDIFLLEPGALLVPSFMGHQPLRAMHGYQASHPDLAALLWSNRPVPETVRTIADVYAYLRSELDAARPEMV